VRKRTGYLIRRGRSSMQLGTVAGKKFMRTTGKRDRREAEKELHRIMEPFVAGDEITTLQNIAARIEAERRTDPPEDELNPPLALAVCLDRIHEPAPGRPGFGTGNLVTL